MMVPPDGGPECVPLDSTGAVASAAGWTELAPGAEINGCIEQVLDAPADIYAVHSVNSPGVVRSWVGISDTAPPGGSGNDCTVAGPGTFLYTSDVVEQLTIFDAPIHAGVGQLIAGGFHTVNATNQPTTGQVAIWLLTRPAPSMVPCAVHGSFAGIEGWWELEPGQEDMTCARLTLGNSEQPFLVRIENGGEGMETVLSVGEPTGPDVAEPCDDTADGATQLAFAKGFTTAEAKPRDVQLLAGQQLVLRVHTTNTSNGRRGGVVRATLF
jgi:hypothetical protein